MLPRSLWWAGALALAATVSAQDFHWGEFQWAIEDDAPQELPSAKLSAPSVPDAMQEFATPAYVEWMVFVPRKGRALHVNSNKSAPWLDPSRLFGEVNQSRVRPARRDGEDVDSEVLLQLVFNPAAAGVETPDAIPRLVVVVPPAYPKLPKGQHVRSRAFMASVRVDREGRVIQVTPAEDVEKPFVQPMIAAVKRWQFAPARQGGEPVEAMLDVPVLFTPREMISPDGRAVAPKPRSQRKPVYPMGLRMAGASGNVVVGFTVSVEGRVVDAWIARSTHPGFDDAALDAVRAWRFEPGRVGGRPVTTRMNVPIHFSIDGEKSFRVTRPKTFGDDLPEALRYDVPPEMEDLQLPAYPLEALKDRQGGKVMVAFMIDAQGRVVQTKVVGQPPSTALADAAVAAVETFRFKPAAKDGKPSPALLRIELEFVSNGRSGHAPVSDDAWRVLRLLEKSPERLVQLGDLDAMPEPVYRRAPLRPNTLPAESSAAVTLEFVIDRNGVARLPRIVEATDRAAAAAAALAVSHWRFEPPRVAGKPVDALARIPIRFAALGSGEH